MEWRAASPQQSDDEDEGVSSLKDGMKHMFQDLASTPSSKSVADWSSFQNDASAESSREVVKVFNQDTVIRHPAPKPESQVSMSDDTSVVAPYKNPSLYGQ